MPHDVLGVLNLGVVLDELGVIRSAVLPKLAFGFGGNKLLAARELLSRAVLVGIPAIELIAGIGRCRRAFRLAGIGLERLTIRRYRSAANSLIVDGDSVLLLPDCVEGDAATGHLKAIGAVLSIGRSCDARVSIPPQECIAGLARNGTEVYVNSRALHVLLSGRHVVRATIRIVRNPMLGLVNNYAIDVIMVAALLDYVPDDLLRLWVVAHTI